MGGASVPRWMWVVLVLVVMTVVGGVRGAPSSSSLPSCPRSCSCPQPTELHCTFRSLHSVPAGINKHVERINLGFNAIHTLTERSLAGLGRLELLMMHGNNIHELPQRPFTDLSSLQMLKMSYNKLVELERDALHGLWSLQRLHLDHNLLEFLHPDAFQGLTSLRLLQLEGNRLQRLHPDTFCTFSLMGGHLHASTLRHLHLSDNALTTLDPALLATMPRLENLYLQGNPWTCDCRMRWLHHWDSVVSPGVLKCKKDRAYAGGQLCPLCSSPRRLRGKELAAAAEQSMVCSGPVITRPAAAAASSRQGAPEDAADDTEVLSAQEFRDPLGNVSLGLSDEHGNQVDLSCSVGPPRELARVEWEQVDLLHLVANVSVSVDLDCPVDRDSYELLWRLIAYYSDTPAHLRRDATQSGGQPRPSYTYRQDMERDALYYTGVRANMAAVPGWLMQSQVDLQLDRPGSTGKSARLVLRTRLTQSVQAEMERRQQRSWVSIDSSNATRTAVGAVAGGPAHLDCRVRSSEPAAVRWVLPDGTRVPAPSGGGPDHRVSVSAEGRLDITAVRHSDAGVYYCMAALRGDLSVLPFRLAVEESSSPPPGGDEESLPVRGFVGEAITLPCHVAAGSPDPRVDWILPGGNVVSLATDNSSSSSSRAAPVVLSNGTLRLPRAQASDGGYYKCVAVNVHGADSLVTKVMLSRRAGGATQPGASARPLRKIPPRPPQSAAGLNTKVRVPTRVEDDEGGSGDEGASEEEEVDKQRGGGVQSRGRGVGGVHPSRTMWRRPVPPQRRPPAAAAPPPQRRPPAAAPPNANNTRRRTGVSNNKIDPAKWAHILAKIRDRTAQSNATTTATTVVASPTAVGRGEEGGEGGRRVPSRNSVEGSSEVDNAEAETAAPSATTERHSEDRSAHVTPDGRSRIRASNGKQPAQGSARFTPDTRRKAAESARDLTTASASPPLLPSPASVAPQRPVTDRQAGAFGSSSAAHNGSVQQRQRLVTAAVDALTPTSDSARTSPRRPESSSGQHRQFSVIGGSRLDPPPTTDEPQQAVTEEGEEGEQDENDERATDLDPEDTRRDDGKSSQAPLTTIVVSPTTAPARRLSGKKGTRGREGGGGGSARRDRPPSSRRRGGNGNGGGRRKPRPERRKPRPDRPGSTTVASTPAEEFPPATAPTRLKIERWGKQASSANVNSAVPFSGGQATTTSPDPLSHTAQSTVSASEPPAPTPSPTPPPASLPPLLTKHMLLPPAKPQAAALPFFPTTSPRGAGGRGRQTAAPGGGVSASESVPTTPAARQRFLTSAPLPSPVKPLEETGRTRGGSVTAAGGGGGDPPLGPAQRATGEPAMSAGPLLAGRGQPDVGRSYAPTEAVGEMLPLTESNERLFSSAAPSVQSGSRRPSGTESASDSTPPIKTTTTAAAEGVLYEEDAADTTKKPALSESSRPRLDEGRTAARIPSERNVSSHEETTPAAAKQPPQSPQSGGKPPLHAAVPASTPVGGRTLGSGTAAVTREGPKFNQIPDSHGERARRPEHRTPLSPAGRDPPLVVVVIGSRPEPERASRPATHSGGQDIVAVRSTSTKPPKATAAQAVRQTTTTVRPARADASRPDASRWPVDASRSRAPTQTTSGGSQRLPGTGSATSRGRPRIANASAGRTVTVPAQEDAQLPCEALGEPMPFLSWTRVSTGTSVAQNTRVQRLEVHPNGTLVIRAAQPSDRGQYLCTVQNQYGSDKALVTLAVLTQHPRVLQPRHRDATVPLGGAVDLECSVAGHPTPRVTWVLPDRVHLSVSPPVIPPSQRVALFDNGTLRISQASYADRGVYKCIGSSPVGADTASVRLHVTLLPPLILQGATEDNHAALPEGGAAYLDCTARGTPPPAVRWTTPQGVTLAPSQFAGRDNVLVFPNGTLLVRALTAASAGRYECVASSSLASSRRTVTLTVVRGGPSSPPSSPLASTKARILSSSPQRTDVLYGGTVRLDCLATGRPEPRIIWRTPSKKLVDSQYSFDPRIKVFANGTLTVRAATEADAGDYLCVARNKMGDDYVLLRAGVLSRAAKIQRKRPQSPSGQQEVVAYGADLKVDCVASGLPDPEISWALPDGTMLNPNKMQQADEAAARPGAGRSRRYVVFDNGTLYLNEVGMREEGDYTCYAQNQLGTDQMKVRVKVEAASEQRAPRVRERPAPVVVRVPYGGTATLNCSAEGEPPPTVSWTSPTHRDIPPTPSDKYQVLPGGILVVHKAQRFDGGNYTCTARNAAGTDRRVITVEVLVTPPTISGAAAATDGVVRVNAVGDQRVTVACSATGLPAPRLTWVLPGNVVLPAPYHGGRVTVHRNGTLDIRAARPADAGRLACVARNEGGEARLAIELDVREESTAERPQVRVPPAAAAAAAAHVILPLTVGKAMTLNCSLEGIVGGGLLPPRHVTWLLPGGTPLLSGARFSKFFHRPWDGALVISNPSLAESGVYRCLGRGAAGPLERTVTLAPGRKPHISNRYDSAVSVLSGEDLLLHCVVSEDGDVEAPRLPRLTWTLPSGVVLGRPQRAGRYAVLANGTLAVRQASVYDRGAYACRVANEYGGALLSATVAVLAFPPRITSGTGSVVYARRGVAVQLNCAASGTPRAEVAWETPDRARLAVSGQPRLYGNKYLHPQGALVIQNPTARDAGVYRCTARNAVGLDSRTTYLNVF